MRSMAETKGKCGSSGVLSEIGLDGCDIFEFWDSKNFYKGSKLASGNDVYTREMNKGEKTR